MRVTLGNEGLIFVEAHEKWWRVTQSLLWQIARLA
jgi:hypothetical protein